MISMQIVFCLSYPLIFAPFVISEESFSSAFIDLNEKNDLDVCISKIIKSSLNCDAFITFAYSNSDVNKLIEDINKDDCYAVNVRGFNSSNWITWNEVYIIVTEDFTELTESLNQLKNDVFWNPRAQFILSTPNINHNKTLTLFQQFLTLKMYQVLLISSRENDEINVSTYQPLHDGNCGEYIEGIEDLGDCAEIKLPKYFGNQTHTDLKNCEFRAVKYSHNSSALHKYSDLPIVEQFVLDSFVNFFNYSIRYKVVIADINYGVVLPNGTITGLLALLQNNTADIAIGSTVVIKNRADVFDFICGFNVASFKLFTSALGKEMWKKVYTEFDTETWLIILSFYLLMIAVCIVLLRMHPKIPHSYVYLTVKLWGFFYLGNGTEPYPKPRRLRSVIAFWIWFTFFISSFYNSDMYSLITGHVQRKRRIEHEKLSSIPYKPCISTVIATFFFFAYNERLPKSLDIPDCRSIAGAFDTVADSTDLYTVQLKESYVERERDFIDREGNRKLDIWDFSNDVVLGFYLNKGFPVKDKLQMHAQRMYECGLVGNYMNLLNSYRGAVDRRKKNIATPFVLGDFRVHFAVLFLGSVLSLFTFIVEMVYNNKNKRHCT